MIMNKQDLIAIMRLEIKSSDEFLRFVLPKGWAWRPFGGSYKAVSNSMESITMGDVFGDGAGL